MIKNILYAAVSCFLMLSLSGCLVAESSYLKKVEEADVLTKSLEDLKQRHDRLVYENSVLKKDFEILRAEASGLTKDKQVLSAEIVELEGVLKAKSDTLSKNISDLRQKNSDLETENEKLRADIRKLKEEIVLLQKVKEEKVKEVSGTYEQLIANMKSEIARGEVTISELRGKLTVNMEAAILFDSGKADVKPGGLEILNKMVGTLKGVTDKSIRIEGHTDNVQITGGLTRVFPTNWELSAARAINVTRYLQEQGIDPASLSAAAFAEYKPVADNASKEGKAKNRRIEITLVAKD